MQPRQKGAGHPVMKIDHDYPGTINIGRYSAKAVLWNRNKDPVPAGETIVAVDTETVKIVKGSPLIPVTMQCYYPRANVVHIVFGAEAMWEYMSQMRLFCSQSTLLFHNVGFDVEVLGGRGNPWLVWMADNGRVRDLGLRYLLDKAATGQWGAKQQRWALDHIVMERLGIYLEKREDIRLTYHPDMDFTPDHFVYAAGDPLATYLAFTTLEGYDSLGLGAREYPTEGIQVKGAIALYHIGHLGIAVDQQRADELHARFTDEMLSRLKILHVFGYYPKAEGQPSAPGSQLVLQRILHNIEERTGILLPRTDKANQLDAQGRRQPDSIKTSREVIEALPDGRHPFLDALREFEYARKVLSTYFGEEYIGTDGRLHASFQPMVKTGRTSCREPNLQNPHKKGGLRGMFTAAPGHVLYSSDYDQLELCALAESCYVLYGESRLMEVINAGMDCHRELGDRIRESWGGADDDGIDYRTLSKIPNFGYPGGLGAAKLVDFAKGFGVELTEEQARSLKKIWLENDPVLRKHLKPPADPDNPSYYIGRTITGRIRRKSEFCAACNYPLIFGADIKLGEFRGSPLQISA